MESPKKVGEPIYLNVYSLGGWNCVLNVLGLGVYHSGVEIFDTEYWYGGHRRNWSGIVREKPCATNLKQEERILVGHTQMSKQEIEREVDFLDTLWIGSEYEPFSHNCNNFAQEFIWRIGRSTLFPPYINGFADMKPLFRIWFLPLKELLGDLVRVANDPTAADVEQQANAEGSNESQIKSITSEQNFQRVKDDSDLQYMVNSYVKALAGFQQCAANSSHCKEDYVLQHVYMGAANCCAKLGKHEDMERYCTMCIEQFPKYVSAYIKRATARRLLRDYVNALNDLKEAYELAPEDRRIAEEIKRLSNARPLIKIIS